VTPGVEGGELIYRPQGEANEQLAHSPEESIYWGYRGCKGLRMLDHLVHFEPEVTSREGFIKLDAASPDELLSAQVSTANLLAELGVDDDDEITIERQTAAARKAFGFLTTNADSTEQKTALAQLKTPAAVRHITGMLAAYDWEFIQQAQEIRGYTVAKLFEETQNPNASIRLKALVALGKVTEIGLFTEKIEIKKDPLTDLQLEQRIKDKLAKFMQVVDVVDIEDVPEPPADATE